MWETWKKSFDAWENATAASFEKLLRNPLLLGPAGSLLTATMRTKAASDRAMAAWWAAMGLSTRRDQERALHKLNQLEGRLLDLEDQLAERRGE